MWPSLLEVDGTSVVRRALWGHRMAFSSEAELRVRTVLLTVLQKYAQDDASQQRVLVQCQREKAPKGSACCAVLSPVICASSRRALIPRGQDRDFAHSYFRLDCARVI